ncbi:hypothetical protein BE20_25730 [Sorangium cellulosum]|nr:hypothetical protein BE20_25730 [Sorangium cellulosum]
MCGRQPRSVSSHRDAGPPSAERILVHRDPARRHQDASWSIATRLVATTLARDHNKFWSATALARDHNMFWSVATALARDHDASWSSRERAGSGRVCPLWVIEVVAVGFRAVGSGGSSAARGCW